MNGKVDLIDYQTDAPHLFREIMLTGRELIKIFSSLVGLPASQLTLLRIMAISHPRTWGVIELAQELAINPAAVTRRVTALEKLGYILKETDQQDNRRFNLRLTDFGRKAFERLHLRSHHLENELTETLTIKQIETARQVLLHLRNGMQNFKKEKKHDRLQN